MRKMLDFKGKPSSHLHDRKAKLAAVKQIKQLYENQRVRHGAALFIGEKYIYI